LLSLKPEIIADAKENAEIIEQTNEDLSFFEKVIGFFRKMLGF
jgi:hypothetical protein